VLTESPPLSIADLLDRAKAAGKDRIDWRDQLVAGGAPTIRQIAPWLADPALGFFAVAVIEPIGRAGHGPLAVRTLRAGRKHAPDDVIVHIDAAIARLSGKPSPA
jgi:hypothetical protein